MEGEGGREGEMEASTDLLIGVPNCCPKHYALDCQGFVSS